MNYRSISLRESFVIKQIISIHYLEYSKDFIYSGEYHDFWEMVYVDRGNVWIQAGDSWKQLYRGEIVFHPPNEFHSIRANGVVAPNTVILSFRCHSKAMERFQNKILHVNEAQKQLLATIINEAKEAFSTSLGDYKALCLERNPRAPFGAEQMIKLSMEQLLISLYRNQTTNHKKNNVILQDCLEQGIPLEIIQFLREHMDKKLSLEQVADYAHISKTGLKDLFHKQIGLGVMTCFRKMKMEQAKIMIREGGQNFTQIAERLGYESIHHFSKQFKQIEGMTLSEYSQSVKSNF